MAQRRPLSNARRDRGAVVKKSDPAPRRAAGRAGGAPREGVSRPPGPAGCADGAPRDLQGGRVDEADPVGGDRARLARARRGGRGGRQAQDRRHRHARGHL